jgi:hypothetical protein
MGYRSAAELTKGVPDRHHVRAQRDAKPSPEKSVLVF